MKKFFVAFAVFLGATLTVAAPNDIKITQRNTTDTADVVTVVTATPGATLSVNGSGKVVSASPTPAAAGTLTGTTLASGVTASSLTSAAGGTFGTNAFTSTGFVPVTTTVNGHALSSNVAVTYSDLGTLPAAQEPAHTGDATNTAGSLAMTVKGINGTLLSGLGNGFLFNTTGTGVPSSVGLNGSGNVVLTTSPSLITPAIGIATGTSLAVTSTLKTTESIGTTSSDGLIAQNSTAATSAVPNQYSPRLRFTSQAWNTSTVSNNTTEWIIENQASSGLNPLGALTYSYQLAGGGYNTAATLVYGGGSANLSLFGSSPGIFFQGNATVIANSSLTIDASSALTLQAFGGNVLSFDSSGNATFTGAIILPKTIAGSTGAQTINKPSGTVQFAAAATSLVVTDSLCTSSSIITGQLATNDATAVVGAIVPTSGSFTIFMKTAPTGTSVVAFRLTN